MTWLTPSYPMSRAIAQDLDTWDLYVDNWGNLIAPSADGSSESFPPVDSVGLPSVAGIMIGPKSTVDRVGVGYNLVGADMATGADILPYPRWLTVGTPLLFLQNGDSGPVISTDPMPTRSSGPPNGSLMVSPTVQGGVPALDQGLPSLNTAFLDAYVKTNGSGGVLGAAAPNGAIWIPPLLHLVFFLKPPTTQVATKRAPYATRLSVAMSVGAAETLAFQIPVFGRKTINLGFTAKDTGVTYRVGGIAQISGSGSPPEEYTLSSGSLTTNVALRVPLTDVKVDYLMIYYERAGAASGQQFNCWINATDD